MEVTWRQSWGRGGGGRLVCLRKGWGGAREGLGLEKRTGESNECGSKHCGDTDVPKKVYNT